MFETPILFLIFNRPETTSAVFVEIKKQKPKYLYIAADGPRSYIFEDREKCKMVRDLVLNNIDWDCEIKTLFREDNLGCGVAVSEAITWFFHHVEAGIILEDDCLPHPSFFNFCGELLIHYKNHTEIFGIGGFNLQNNNKRGKASYFFSNYSHIWGWATWRRAWYNYDHNLQELNQFKKNKKIKKIDKRDSFKKYWMLNFDNILKGDFTHIWDYQWLFTIWNNEAIIVVPNVNLISNIGFGNDATHTSGNNSYAYMRTFDIGKIRHPTEIRADKVADRYISDNVFKINNDSIMRRLRKKILKFYRGL